MQKKIPLLTAIIVLTTVLAIPLTTRTVVATSGVGVGDPTNLWSPYGPNIGGTNKLELVYYSTMTAELNGFQAGQVDVTDWPESFAQWGPSDANSNFLLSPTQGEFGAFGYYFNGASSWFTKTNTNAGAPWWGCDWNSAGFTYNTACGVEFRQALAHLINRRDFNQQQHSVALGDFNPPAKYPAGTPTGASPAGSSINTIGAAITGSSLDTAPNGGSTGVVVPQCGWDVTVMVAQNTNCYGGFSNSGPTCVGPTRDIPSTNGVDLGCYNSATVDGAYTITGSGACSGPLGLTGTGGVQTGTTCAVGSGFPGDGSPDFCAAALHLKLAGIAATINSANCHVTGLTAAASALCAHPLRFIIRLGAPRLPMGIGMTGRLQALLGDACGGSFVVAGNGSYGGCPCGIAVAGKYVFHDLTTTGEDDWDMYTYGYSLPGPFGGDALFPLYRGTGTLSPNAANVASNGGVTYPDVAGANNASPCAEGTTGDQPNVANFVCNQQLDALLDQQLSTLNAATYSSYTMAVYSQYGRMVADIPVFTQALRIEALATVGGLVNSLGFGYATGATLLQAHPSSYVPSGCTSSTGPAGCSPFLFGSGDASTLRWGQGDGTDSINVFNAQTVWEFQTLQMYDTLFSASPVNPTNVFCWMCTGTPDGFFSGPFNPTVDINGNEHFRIELRQNLRWQDARTCSPQPSCGLVTAADVAFSLMALRDLAPTAGGSLFGTLLSVKVLDNFHLDVTMIGQSILYAPELEAFVIPQRIWGCNVTNDCNAGATDVNLSNGPGLAEAASCTDGTAPLGSTCVAAQYTGAVDPSAPAGTVAVQIPSHNRSQPTYDPMQDGTLIGSGAYECVSNSGNVGGPCSSTGTGTIPTGSVLLTAYDNTGLAGNTDPFNQFQRTYNANFGVTGSGTAASSGQLNQFLYSNRFATTTSYQVTVADISDINGCVGHAATGSCAYWHRAAFDGGTITAGELNTVLSNRDDQLLYPYPWVNTAPPNGLINICNYGATC